MSTHSPNELLDAGIENGSQPHLHDFNGELMPTAAISALTASRESSGTTASAIVDD